MASRSKKMIDELYQLHQRLVKEIQTRLDDKEHPPTLGELTALLSKVGDLRLTEQWTKKLQAAILKTHGALLTHPTAQGVGMLQKAKAFALQVNKTLKGDGRRSATKVRRAVGDGINLPFDEEPSN